jgi:pentose-5-phosphate-3-epimerase
MKGPAIVASVLGADYAKFGHEVAEVEAAGVDRIQWDIMDGRFVPQPELWRRRRSSASWRADGTAARWA